MPSSSGPRRSALTLPSETALPRATSPVNIRSPTEALRVELKPGDTGFFSSEGKQDSAAIARDRSNGTVTVPTTASLSQLARQHLESMATSLLQTEAPALLKDQKMNTDTLQDWVDTLLGLVLKVVNTLEADVKGGDLLDIRNYMKLKTVPGGVRSECSYLSGVVFQKNVSHKQMARRLENPRVMLLSGGIEFTRTENRIASLDTLLEQEEKYMAILVAKIVGLKPDLLLVGRSVSRQAQELLLRAGVV